MRMRTWIAFLAVGVVVALFAPSAGVSGGSASGANMIYWGDNSAGKISFANLDGAGDGGVVNNWQRDCQLPERRSDRCGRQQDLLG